MIIYFSGTGNSHFAAEFLSKQLQDDLLNAGEEIKDGKRGTLYSARPWVFVAPTYAWRVPHIFADYLRKASLSGSREAYFVLTCGGDIGNAGKYAAALCTELDLQYRGILEVVMPENYIAMFDAPEQQEARQIVAQAIPVLQTGAERILHNEPFPVRKTGAMDRLKSGIVNRAFYSLFVKADAFYATDACTGCGFCEKACPLNNIQIKGGHPVWGKNCTHCMACICGCSAEAIEYGKKSIGKPRYRCPIV